MKHVVAVNTNTYHGFSVEEALQGIADAGFKHIEPAAVKGWTEHIMPDMSEEEIVKIEKRMAELGLKPIALSGHCSITDKERLPDFYANIDLAQRLGCEFIVTSVDEAHLEKEETDSLELRPTLRELGKVCKEKGLKLALETHGEKFGTGQSLHKLLEEVGSDNVFINFDTANVIMYGNVDPLEDLKACYDKLAFIHLKDKLGEQKEWNFPAVGSGNIDFEAIFAFLEEKGLDVPLSIEIEFTSAGPKDLDEVNDAAKSAYNYLNGLGIVL